MQDSIVIKGARVHNLKNIDVEIPRNTMTVVTGISGSGKSSQLLGRQRQILLQLLTIRQIVRDFHASPKKI